MTPMSDLILTESILRRFSPLDSLKRENIAALAKKMEIRSLESGKTLLREGDTDKRTYYLVSGTLELARSQQQPEIAARRQRRCP
jgi:CRP-like cAMP-binding protein